MATATPTASREEGTLFGHPKGLAFLFFTEMWERFSFYGMRALLTLYMVNYLFLQPDVGAQVLGFNWLKHLFQPGKLDPQPLSSTVYGLYTGFVYLTPFVGGLLADRVLGRRRAVVLGAVLMAIGHFLMAIQSCFFLALMFLILGNGAFKPNISTQVGGLYKQGDPRRDRAFSIFYVGINIGAFFSPLVCGTLGQMGRNTWHWGFGAAGIGMVVGLIVYLCGQKYLPQMEDDNLVVRAVPKIWLKTLAFVLGAAVFACAFFLTQSSPLFVRLIVAAPALGWIVWYLTQLPRVWGTILGYVILTPVIIVLLMLLQASPAYIVGPVAGVLVVASAVWLIRLPQNERGPVVALCILCFCTIFFWATYEQQGNTVQLWADKYTDFRLVKNADARAVLVLDEKKKDKVQLLEGEVLADAGGQYYAVKGKLAEQYAPLEAERAPLQKQLDDLKAQSNAAAKEAIEKQSAEAVQRKAEFDEQADGVQKQIDAINVKVKPLMGLAMPTTWFQSFNPFLIFTLTPFVTWFWARQARKQKEASTVAKMAIGCLLVGISYAVMIAASRGAAGGYKAGILWLVGFSIIVTLGELYVSPIGLSLVTKLAPARMVSMLMGVWFLATYVGNNLSGQIGTLFDKWPPKLYSSLPTALQQAIDTAPKPVFWVIPTVIACATALLIFLLHHPVQRAIGGAEAASDV